MISKFLFILSIAVVTAQAQLATLTDSRDGKKYKTVKIGNQIWMAENLNYDASGSVCYDNNSANCEKYGRLYNWETAMEVCPLGWHLPSNIEEWEGLSIVAGGVKVAGKKLKSKSGWNDYQGKSGNGTDEFEFSALPGGFGNSDSSFDIVGYNGYWWSSSERGSNYAYYRYMFYNYEYASWNYDVKSYLLSVRCLKN